mmetsp:Transcript_22070/g.48483  ORF Transcript_22070/g.48483 Transcript_22070/m.48483 type:complete len:288 (-) Transcript_22070:63-926(-)
MTAPIGHVATQTWKRFWKLHPVGWANHHIVTTGCLGTGDVLVTRQALALRLVKHQAARNRIPGPFAACGESSIPDDFQRQFQLWQLISDGVPHLGHIAIDQPLLVAYKAQHGLLKALFGDVFTFGAQAVGVSTAMVGRDGPCHFLRGAFWPHRGRLRRQLQAVDAWWEESLQATGRAQHKILAATIDSTARAEDFGRAGRPPGVLAGPIARSCGHLDVESPEFFVVHCGFAGDGHEVAIPHAIVPCAGTRVGHAAVLPVGWPGEHTMSIRQVREADAKSEHGEHGAR